MAIGDLLDDLGEHDDWPDKFESNAAAATLKRHTERPVVCIAGRTRLDECAALMLAQLLGKHGLSAQVEGRDALLASKVDRLDTAGAAILSPLQQPRAYALCHPAPA